MQSEAVWFSPDSRSIVYATFNDSEVGEIKFVDYGKVGDNYSVYPKTNAIRYPKVNPSIIVLRSFEVLILFLFAFRPERRTRRSS